MKPQNHHRRSIRLKERDYSQADSYFVTICCQNRVDFYGEIENAAMKLNDAGKMIKNWYHELENKFPEIKCGEMIIMPNHIHFITILADLHVCPDKTGERDPILGEHTGSPLHRVVQWLKTMTTNEYIRGVKSLNWQRFNKRLWQRNYYEHIIRNENEYNRIAKYIVNNPAKWNNDKLNNNTPNMVMEERAEYGMEKWMI